MSVKLSGISSAELLLLAKRNKLHPAFSEEACYIASGPEYELLAVEQPDGLFEVQILDKAQTAVAVNETILVLRQFVQQSKTARIL